MHTKKTFLAYEIPKPACCCTYSLLKNDSECSDWVLPFLLFIIRYDSWILLFLFLLFCSLFHSRCVSHFQWVYASLRLWVVAVVMAVVIVMLGEKMFDFEGTLYRKWLLWDNGKNKNKCLYVHHRQLGWGRERERRDFGFCFSAQNI